MTYVIFSLAVVLLSVGLCQYEPQKSGRIGTENHFYALLGPAAHLGGSLAIGWTEGLIPGAVAFALIPVVAYAFHSLVILPLVRAKRLRTSSALPRSHAR